MILIGLSGKKLSGKDTFYLIASQLIKANTVRIGFADALKEEIAKEFNTTVEYINQNKDKFRLIMQHWGCLKRELIHQDYWIWKVRDRILKLDSESDVSVVFITDVRFKNEASWLKNTNGFLLRINRGYNLPVSDSHISETELDSYTEYDHLINNFGTLNDFKKLTLSALKHIQKSLTPKHNIIL